MFACFVTIFFQCRKQLDFCKYLEIDLKISEEDFCESRVVAIASPFPTEDFSNQLT